MSTDIFNELYLALSACADQTSHYTGQCRNITGGFVPIMLSIVVTSPLQEGAALYYLILITITAVQTLVEDSTERINRLFSLQQIKSPEKTAFHV